MKWVGDCNKEWLHFFNYAKVPQDPTNNTGFFELDGTDEGLMRQYGGFRAQNRGMIDWVCQLTDEDLEGYRYRLSDPSKEVPLMDFSTADKATKAIGHFM